eukprot:265268-Rhodomonas_salina.1
MKNAQVSCAANDDGFRRARPRHRSPATPPPFRIQRHTLPILPAAILRKCGREADIPRSSRLLGHHFHVARTGQNQTAASAEPTEREEAAEGRAAAESKRSVSKLVPPWEGGKEGGREGESKAEATLAVLLAQVQRLGERQM